MNKGFIVVLLALASIATVAQNVYYNNKVEDAKQGLLSEQYEDNIIPHSWVRESSNPNGMKYGELTEVEIKYCNYLINTYNIEEADGRAKQKGLECHFNY